MRALFKRVRDAIWLSTSPLATEMFVSKTAAREIEGILPGEILTITLSGRKFVIVEREEFELIVDRAGMQCKASS